jgi:hypothetical protein
MKKFVVSSSARIHAAPERVYAILADYLHEHPRILPKQFSGFRVESGGFGAGTIIRFSMRILGQTLEFRGFVTEPEPGRVLVERNAGDQVSTTTFTIDPVLGGKSSKVTISTELPVPTGMFGTIERFLTKRTLRAIYKEELDLLTDAATRRR